MRVRAALLLAALALLVPVAASAPSALRALGAIRAGQIEVPVYRVERGDFERRIHAEGNLEPVRTTELTLSPTIRGSAKVAWLATDGSEVREGEVVIRFDPSELQQKLDEGRSERAVTESQIAQHRVRGRGEMTKLGRDAELAEVELGYANEFQSKDEEIFARNEIIESDIDRTLAEQRKSRAEHERALRGELAEVELELLGLERRKAELQIEQARRELAELEVRAPHDGIFVVRESWQGPLQVGSVVWSGNTVGEIPRLDEMQARIHVLEADAGGLVPGLPAEVSLDAHPGRTFPARVHRVDALAKRRDRRVPVQYFGVVLELEHTDPQLMKPGQRVQATITVDERQEVLTVPRQSVFDRDGRSVVYVRRGGSFVEAEVRVGAAGLGRVVVEEGVREGDLVALGDPTRRVREPADAAAEDAPAAAPRTGS